MDNWKHRSDNMKCKTCMYFVEKKRGRVSILGGTISAHELARNNFTIAVPEKPPTEKEAIGRCRRHAPTLNGWPIVFMEDWCGDHRLDEEKV